MTMTSSNKEAKVSWLLHTQRPWDEQVPSEADVSKNLELLYKVFIEHRDTLGYESAPLASKLMDVDGLELSIGVTENAIDSGFLQGAGEIDSSHSKHLVMLLLLERVAMREGFDSNIAFCDAEGNSFPNDSSIPELFNLFEQFGFNKDELRQHAEVIGLCEKAIDLSALNEVEQEDFFF